MRDRIVPLTRASLADGGAANKLKEAFATEIIADIDPKHRNLADARETPALVGDSFARRSDSSR
jgi:hypothetical protein